MAKKVLALLDEGKEDPVVDCFDQILMAGRNISKLISKPHVLPPTGCRGNIVRVLASAPKLLLLGVRLSVF